MEFVFLRQMHRSCNEEGVVITYRATARIERNGVVREEVGCFTSIKQDEAAAKTDALVNAIAQAKGLAFKSFEQDWGDTGAKNEKSEPPVRKRALSKPSPIKKEEEAAKKKQEQEDLKKKRAEEEKRKNEEEERLRQQQEEEEERLRQEEEERLRQEEEEERQRKLEEEERLRQEEEERQRKEEEDRVKAEREEEIRQEEERKRLEEEQQQQEMLRQEEEREKRKEEEKKKEEEELANRKEEERKLEEQLKREEEEKKRPPPPRASAPSAPSPAKSSSRVKQPAPRLVKRNAGPPVAQSRKQLSLSSRKNVKQFQPNFAEHVNRLREALNLDIQIQSKVDWILLAERCDVSKSHKFCCGEVFYESIMSHLAANLITLSPAGRAQLLAEWSSGAISISFDADQEERWTTRFVEGEMELLCREEPWEDLKLVGMDFVQQFHGENQEAVKLEVEKVGGKCLSLGENIQKFESCYRESADVIGKALGFLNPPTHVIDFEELNEFCKHVGLENKAGEIFQKEIMKGLAHHIESYCQHSLVPPALKKMWPSGVIDLAYNHSHSLPYSTIFQKGSLMIYVRPDALAADYETVGCNLLARVCDEESGLPVLSAQNLKDTENLQLDHLERIRAAMGLSMDVVCDVDFFEVCAFVDEGRFFSLFMRVVVLLCSLFQLKVLRTKLEMSGLQFWTSLPHKLKLVCCNPKPWRCCFSFGPMVC